MFLCLYRVCFVARYIFQRFIKSQRGFSNAGAGYTFYPHSTDRCARQQKSDPISYLLFVRLTSLMFVKFKYKSRISVFRYISILPVTFILAPQSSGLCTYVGCSGGAMVLGKLPVPGRPT